MSDIKIKIPGIKEYIEYSFNMFNNPESFRNTSFMQMKYTASNNFNIRMNMKISINKKNCGLARYPETKYGKRPILPKYLSVACNIEDVKSPMYK